MGSAMDDLQGLTTVDLIQRVMLMASDARYELTIAKTFEDRQAAMRRLIRYANLKYDLEQVSVRNGRRRMGNP